MSAELLSTADVSRQLEVLTQKIQALEDEQCIRNLIVRYGFALDAGDAEAAMALFTDDCIFEVSAPATGRTDTAKNKENVFIMRGRESVGGMVLSEPHQSLLPNCAHTIGPVVIDVQGDKATATGYTRIYLKEDQHIRLFRLGINHWELVKQPEWRIHRRVSQVLGEQQAQELLKAALVNTF